MAITVEVTPVLSDKAREQIRAIVREEFSRLTGTPICVHCKETSVLMTRWENNNWVCINCRNKGLQ